MALPGTEQLSAVLQREQWDACWGNAAVHTVFSHLGEAFRSAEMANVWTTRCDHKRRTEHSTVGTQISDRPGEIKRGVERD